METTISNIDEAVISEINKLGELERMRLEVYLRHRLAEIASEQLEWRPRYNRGYKGFTKQGGTIILKTLDTYTKCGGKGLNHKELDAYKRAK